MRVALILNGLGFLFTSHWGYFGCVRVICEAFWALKSKRGVYDGDMVVYSGTMGDLWGVMGAKREAKEGQATNLQAQGGRRDGARRPRV